MPLGIDPRVDFAFKLMLGSPEHPLVTIHFLNAILRIDPPIVDVEILNPLIGKERSEEKIVLLDVLAKDSLGRQFNIEMQTRLIEALPSRLLFYNCRSYQRQLLEGNDYEKLCPAISICVLDRLLFREPTSGTRWHHSFRLRSDQQRELVLTDDFEFHILELPNFTPRSHNVEKWSPAEKWMFLFKHAVEMEAGQLADLLVDKPFREAIGVLEMLSQSEEEYQIYEARMKALRDHNSLMSQARREGLKEGRQEGRDEAKEPLIKTISMLQELLPEGAVATANLPSKSLDELVKIIEDLQGRLRQHFTR